MLLLFPRRYHDIKSMGTELTKGLLFIKQLWKIEPWLQLKGVICTYTFFRFFNTFFFHCKKRIWPTQEFEQKKNCAKNVVGLIIRQTVCTLYYLNFWKAFQEWIIITWKWKLRKNPSVSLFCTNVFFRLSAVFCMFVRQKVTKNTQ